jgi:hypothetical protein
MNHYTLENITIYLCIAASLIGSMYFERSLGAWSLVLLGFGNFYGARK